jgi:hypothetical protein
LLLSDCIEVRPQDEQGHKISEEVVESFSILLLADYIVADRLEPELGVWLENLWVVYQQLQNENLYIQMAVSVHLLEQ